MKLSEFYASVIRCGVARDPRKKEKILHFEDTAILYGNPAKIDVSNILVGIDIEGSELLLADRLREKEGLDLALAHHPQGKAWAAFFEVMRLQTDLLQKVGVARAVAQGFIEQRKDEVARRVHSGNHARAVDIARILDIPFMCCHTPADNQAAFFIEQLLNKEKPKQVQDILDILMGVEEYQGAAKNLAGPRIILGSPKRSVGKIFVEMTGGTEGPKEVYDSLYRRGIRTLVSMHLSEEHFKKVKDVQLNVVLAGHISSDTLGMNLLLDYVETSARQRFNVISCSGFRRIRR